MVRSRSRVCSTSAWILSVRLRRRRLTAAIAASSWVRGPKKTSLDPPRAGCDPVDPRPTGLSTRACSLLTTSSADGDLSGAFSGVPSCAVTGTVAEVNEELPDEPQQINQAPYDAWIAKITDVTGTEELLSAEEYAALCETAKE